MRILLPPSEGKAVPRSGRPVVLPTLSHPALTEPRERVIDALVALCGQADSEPARAALGLGPTQQEEVRRNARLRAAATLPASRLYNGVLYEALDLATLPEPAKRRAGRWIVIFSGLWGLVRLFDRLPAYRCPVGATLPGVGGLTGFWRRVAADAFATAFDLGGPVLDLRSSGYASMWTPSGELAARTLAVRVLHERVVDGVSRRTPVSHFNKATKGRLVRDLALAGVRPRTPADLIAALPDLGYPVVAHEPVAGRPRGLDVIVSQL